MLVPKLLIGTTLMATTGIGNLFLVTAIQSTVYYTTTWCLWGLTTGAKKIYKTLTKKPSDQ